MKKFSNHYNPAYQVTSDGRIVRIDLDTEYSYDNEGYRSYDRSKYYRESELLSRKQALRIAIPILEAQLAELKQEEANLEDLYEDD